MTAPFFLQQSLHLGGQHSMSMLGQHGIDPSSNDQPLQFNSKSGPKVIMGSSMDDGKKDGRDMMGMPRMQGMSIPGPGMNNSNMGGNAMNIWNEGSMWNNGMGMGEGGGMIPTFGNIGGDNVGLGRGGMPGGGMHGGMVGGNNIIPPHHQMMQQKEIIHLSGATLIPPPAGAPLPSIREKPFGCRTIFVGGLPENITEDIVREMFACCGEIISYRKGKKNFCHVRFTEEESVDKAVYISGYRICINNSKEPDDIGRIHVDYAQARDDQYDFECRQRQYAREMRHRHNMEEQLMRPSSPPVTSIPYSDHEAGILAENLKSEEHFMKAATQLVSWLERGESSKRTSSNFYSMIQSINSQVRRLMTEKQLYNDEFEVAKNVYRQRIHCLFNQFGLVENVFVSATKQRAWDHFTKPQRKNIDAWKKQVQEIKEAQQGEMSSILNEKGEAEMDLSDDEVEPKKDEPEMDIETKRMMIVQSAQAYAANNQLAMDAKRPRMENHEEMNKLKEDNDVMKCQLEAFKNEVELVRMERTKEYEEKDTQIKALQHALLGMQQQLMEAKSQIKKTEEEKKKEEPEPSELTNWLKTTTPSVEVEAENKEQTTGTKVVASDMPEAVLTEKHGMLVGLLATFLHVHPFGASIEYLWSYLQRLDPKVTPQEIESILVKLPTVFKQELFGVGATLEKRWQFIGFKTCLNEKE